MYVLARNDRQPILRAHRLPPALEEPQPPEQAPDGSVRKASAHPDVSIDIMGAVTAVGEDTGIGTCRCSVVGILLGNTAIAESASTRSPDSRTSMFASVISRCAVPESCTRDPE